MTSNDATIDGERSDGSAGCITEIDIDPGGLFFADTMAAYDGFSGTLVPYQTTDGAAHSLLRTNSVEYGVLENRARADSTVKAVSYLRTVNGEHLYDLELLFAPECPFRRLAADQFRVLSAGGVAEKWRVLLWLESPELLELCRRSAEEADIGWDVRGVYRAGSYNPLDELTSVQRETVERALELGYFDIPRTVSMEELAAELDVTPNAVSERLRRAERRLLSALLSGSSGSATLD